MAWISISCGIVVLVLSGLELAGVMGHRKRASRWAGLALGTGILIQGVAQANHAVGSLWFGLGTLLVIVGALVAARDSVRNLQNP